jgi:hypothetical protein
MAIDLAKQCAFPQDLEAAAFALQQQIGDELTAALAKVKQIEAAGVDIPAIIAEANKTIDQLLSAALNTGSPLTSGVQMEKLLGIPKDSPNINDDEDQVFYAGIPLFDGVIYTFPSSPTTAKPTVNILNQNTPNTVTGTPYLTIHYGGFGTVAYLTLQPNDSGVLTLSTTVYSTSQVTLDTTTGLATTAASTYIPIPADNLSINASNLNITQLAALINMNSRYTATENSDSVVNASDLDQITTVDEVNLVTSDHQLTASAPAKIDYTNNIEHLRRLYFAAGRDLGRTSDFAKLLNSPGLSSFQLLNRAVVNVVTVSTAAQQAVAAATLAAANANAVEAKKSLKLAQEKGTTSLEDLSPLAQNAKAAEAAAANTAASLANTTTETLVINDIRSQLNAPYLTFDSIAKLDDGRYLALTYSFIGKDTSIASAGPGVPVKSSFFHYRKTDTSPQASPKYKNLGYSGDYLSAILNGTDLIETVPGTINKLVTDNQNRTKTLIKQIEWILDHNKKIFNQGTGVQSITAVPIGTSIAFYDGHVQELKDILDAHVYAMATNEFQVTVALQNDTLDNLRKDHTDTEITRLLEQRPLITGLNFDGTLDDKTHLIKQASKSGANTIAVSSNFFNFLTPTTVNTTALLSMLGDLQQAVDTFSLIANIASVSSNGNIGASYDATVALQKTAVYLTKYAGGSPFFATPKKTIGSTTLPNEIQQGLKSIGSPMATLAAAYDPIKSFKVVKVVQDLESLELPFPDWLIKALKTVINAITYLFEQADAAVVTITKQLNNFVLPLKKKIDALTTKYLALTGGGSFDSSLLKCAISFDLGISFALADILLALINNMGALAQGFISPLIGLISDMLTKILCVPMNIINQLLGLVNSLLPPFCAVPKFDLPLNLALALGQLTAVGGAKTLVYQQMNTDLLTAKASISMAALKGAQFKLGASCSSAASGTFMAAMGLNLVSPTSPAPLSSFGVSTSTSGLLAIAKAGVSSALG